jgi:hypothetical protein
MTERIHMAKKPLVLNKKGYEQSEGPKPRGLWYGIGDSWKEWVLAEMPHWLGEHTYRVNTRNANILLIQTPEQLIEFNREHARKEWYVDWNRIAAKHEGIEINPYQWKYRHKYLWYYGWDVASGCVWNLENITVEPENPAAGR